MTKKSTAPARTAESRLKELLKGANPTSITIATGDICYGAQGKMFKLYSDGFELDDKVNLTLYVQPRNLIFSF